MKKIYISPSMEVQRFEVEDILTTSAVDTKGSVLTNLGAEVSNFDVNAEAVIAATDAVFN